AGGRGDFEVEPRFFPVRHYTGGGNCQRRPEGDGGRSGKVLARYRWELKRERLKKKGKPIESAGEQPECDAITQHVIDVFLMASRSRRYAIGMAGGFPLPLSVADITAVLDAHPSPLPREELDACIFALD